MTSLPARGHNRAMQTHAITGSASGIGAAIRTRLESEGHRVIGVDLHDAEVIADLSTEAGRAEMVAGVTAACGGGLDGLVAGAGTLGPEPELVVRVNYFGAIATLDGLRPLLAANGGAAVAISSNSCSTVPGLPGGLIDACLAGEEEAAVARSVSAAGQVYPSSKLALARWVRREATRPDWIGAGVRLNAVAPGLIDTPMMDGEVDTVLAIGDGWPVPIGRAGRAEEIAALIGFLLSPDASLFCGS